MCGTTRDPKEHSDFHKGKQAAGVSCPDFKLHREAQVTTTGWNRHKHGPEELSTAQNSPHTEVAGGQAHTKGKGQSPREPVLGNLDATYHVPSTPPTKLTKTPVFHIKLILGHLKTDAPPPPAISHLQEAFPLFSSLFPHLFLLGSPGSSGNLAPVSLDAVLCVPEAETPASPKETEPRPPTPKPRRCLRRRNSFQLP